MLCYFTCHTEIFCMVPDIVLIYTKQDYLNNSRTQHTQLTLWTTPYKQFECYYFTLERKKIMCSRSHSIQVKLSVREHPNSTDEYGQLLKWIKSDLYVAV